MKKMLRLEGNQVNNPKCNRSRTKFCNSQIPKLASITDKRYG